MKYLKTPTPAIIQSKQDVILDAYRPQITGKIYLCCETEYTDLLNERVQISFHYYKVEDGQFVQMLLPAGNQGVTTLPFKVVNQFALGVKAQNPKVDLEAMSESDRRVFLLSKGMYLMIDSMTEKPYGLEATDFEEYVPIEIVEPTEPE